LNDCTPLVTIGIPIKNRGTCIARLLESIETLDYPKPKIELVFVDAFSVDGTYEAMVNWRDKNKIYFYDIKLIQKETNIPQARNVILNNSHGEYVLFWDSDVVPPEGLLKKMVCTIASDKNIGMVGADYRYEHEDFFTRTMGQPLTDKRASYAFMGFTLIRREVFSKIGTFNESLYRGEDEELFLRVIEKTSYKTVWASEPVLHFKEPESLRNLYKWSLLNAFHKRGEEHARDFLRLPLFLKMRLFYYGLLPITIILTPIISFYTNPVLGILLLTTYFLLGLLVAVRKSNVRRGMVSFFTFDLPVNTAVSYGALTFFLRDLFNK